jgi:hypothetical protein
MAATARRRFLLAADGPSLLCPLNLRRPAPELRRPSSICPPAPPHAARRRRRGAVGAMAGTEAGRVEVEAAMRGLPSLPPTCLGPSAGSPSSPAPSPVAVLSSTLSAQVGSSTSGFVATSYHAVYAMAACRLLPPPSLLGPAAAGRARGCGPAAQARLPTPLLLPLPTRKDRRCAGPRHTVLSRESVCTGK